MVISSTFPRNGSFNIVTDESSAKDNVSIGAALIVDDHPLFCEALSLTLKSGMLVERIMTADRLEAAIEILENDPPDVILLDLSLPDVEGLEGVIQLHRAAKGVPIIVISSLAEQRIIASAISAGAAGFVPKHSQRDVFLQAFRDTLAGRTYLPEGFVETDGEGGEAGLDANGDAVQRLRRLTQQQAKILELVCLGKLNKQIAYDLGIAETTVKAHITAILRKLGVQSRTQAVLLAQDAKFAKILHDGRSVP